MTQAALVRRAARHGGRAGPSQSDGRYGLLLVVLISTYLLSAFSLSRLAETLQLVLFLAVLVLALRTAKVTRRQAIVTGLLAMVGSAAFAIAALTLGQTGRGGADIWKGLVLLLTAVLIVRRVLARPTVTMQSIYGALSAYLIIGLMFAAFYAAMGQLAAGSFFAAGQAANTQTFQYFSFTTLTTLGYGDFTAVGNGGRAIAVLEALTGQVFLATLVARLVSAFRVPAERNQPGASRRCPQNAIRTAQRRPRRRISGQYPKGGIAQRFRPGG